MAGILVVSSQRRHSATSGMEMPAAACEPAVRAPPEILTLKDRAYLALRTSIVQLDLNGGRGPIWFDERELAERLGMSRTPVREALAVLERQGLVSILARKGIKIVRKSRSEIVEMIQAWAALAGLAARLSAWNATDGELASLQLPSRSSLAAGSARSRARKIEVANLQFHAALFRLSGCGVIGFLLEDFSLYIQSVWSRTAAQSDYATRWITAHVAIIDALRARNASLAEGLVQENALELTQHA